MYNNHQSRHNNMLPEKTEVYYRGILGYVNFSDPAYMTICVRQFPDQPNRDVCLVVPPERWDEIELANGNQNERS